jgi:hypothetical protein
MMQGLILEGFPPQHVKQSGGWIVRDRVQNDRRIASIFGLPILDR